MFHNGLKIECYWPRVALLLGGFCLAAMSNIANASTYILPKGDVVGQVQYATATATDTLYDIARRYDVGINAITAANPGINPKKPPAGARILIPSRHILPSGPREGIVISLAEMRLYYYAIPEEPKKETPAEVATTSEGQAALAVTPPVTPPAEPAATAALIPLPIKLPFPAPIPAAAQASPPAGQPVSPEAQAAALLLQIPAVKRLPEPPLVSTYPISISSECLAIRQKEFKVEQRLSRPSWTVPESTRRAQPSLPDVVLPGPKNPLGDFAIGLDHPEFMIHGTNNPASIGTKVSTGCVRMYPGDIDLLINRIATGIPVRIVNESLKHGYKNGALYLEFHKPEGVSGELNLAALVNWMDRIVTVPMSVADWQRVRMVAEGTHAVAMPVMQLKAKPRPERGLVIQLTSYKTAHSARALIKKIEVMGVPLSITGCYGGKLCTVVAGPFKDRNYTEELLKKIKWVTNAKGRIIAYQEEDDFQLPLLQQKVARAE